MQAKFRSHIALAVLLVALEPTSLHAQRPGGSFTIEQIKSYPFPNELTAASSGSRIAWALNERGLRNIWVAEGPDFTARRLTNYTADDGQELTSISISQDGKYVVYVRGGDHGGNWDESVPVNPTESPTGFKVEVWSVPFAGGSPKALAEGDEPAISPRGDRVAFTKNHEIWTSPIDGATPAKKFFAVRGNLGDLAWSSDGSRLAFVADRGDHAWIGIFASDSAPIVWLSPSSARDLSPRWSPDGKRLGFAANACTGINDDDRRHVVKVPVDSANPQMMTPGSGLEWNPFVTGDGQSIVFIGATAQRPPVPAVMPIAGGTPRLTGADRIPTDFPAAQLVTPRKVVFKSSDGLTIHGQLFEKTGQSGKKPAVIFVHGGPPRQMLLGWHYSDYYSNEYAENQYLANLGFVVLSVNYRLGIGYGHEFHHPPNSGTRGAAEYLDVKAGADYLRSLPQVDASRIGIYGGSY